MALHCLRLGLLPIKPCQATCSSLKATHSDPAFVPLRMLFLVLNTPSLSSFLPVMSYLLFKAQHKHRFFMKFFSVPVHLFICITHVVLMRSYAILSFQPSLVSPSTSYGSLTERLLRQNAELTGHISQLTEEKNGLRNLVMKLEEQIRWDRQTGTGRDYVRVFLAWPH